MIHYCLLIFMLQVSNRFDSGIDLYRVPDYRTGHYLEVVNLKSGNEFTAEMDHFYLFSLFQIHQVAGLRESESENFEHHILQMDQLYVNLNWRFLYFKAGRIRFLKQLHYLPAIDGFQGGINSKYLQLDYIQGSGVTPEHFLGVTTPFDTTLDQGGDHYLLSITGRYRGSWLTGGYHRESRGDTLLMERLYLNGVGRISSNIEFDGTLTYHPDLTRFSTLEAGLHLWMVDLRYSYDYPVFPYDSIFNFFIADGINRFELSGKWRWIKGGGFYNPEDDHFGLHTSVQLGRFGFGGSIEPDRFTIRGDLHTFIGCSLRYFQQESLKSVAGRLFRNFNVLPGGSIYLYTDLIYSTHYDFQMSTGLLVGLNL